MSADSRDLTLVKTLRINGHWMLSTKGNSSITLSKGFGTLRKGHKEFWSGRWVWHGELMSRHDIVIAHSNSQLLWPLHNTGLLTPFPHLWNREALRSWPCVERGGSQGPDLASCELERLLESYPSLSIYTQFIVAGRRDLFISGLATAKCPNPLDKSPPCFCK